MIWAQTTAGVIGADESIPWHIPEDFAHFKATTMGAPVIMGRKTWQSLPQKARPLPGRTNIVISRDANFSAPGATLVASIEEAVAAATSDIDQVPSTIWVMGGAAIYEQFMDRAERLVVTVINAAIEGDSYAPQIPNQWTLTQREPATGWQKSKTGLEFAILEYLRT